MANIPTPEVAKGTPVGAKQGRSADEFHPGPYHDIRDFGASTSLSDNSNAIEKALLESATTGGAALIPEGRFKVEGWRCVDVTSAMDGATLVGDAGADSVIVTTGSSDVGIAFFDDAHRDVTLANFRIDASTGRRGISSPADKQGKNFGENLRFENLWIHGAWQNQLSISLMDGDPICETYNLSVWGTTEFHGAVFNNMGGPVRMYDTLAWDNGIEQTTEGGNAVDTSGSHALLDGFLFVNNSRGTKVTAENVHTEYRNGVILDNLHTGFHASGGQGKVVFDNVLVRGCGDEGFSLRDTDYEVPTTIWAIDNAQNTHDHTNAGIEYAYGATIDANEIQVGGTQNGYPGVTDTTNDANGNVEKLIAADNTGGTFGNKGNVSYGSNLNQACDVPSIEDILGKTSDSSSAKIQYHDGTNWQDATMRYFDGEQFTDVTMTQLSSN
jgi:hypothetical protein